MARGSRQRAGCMPLACVNLSRRLRRFLSSILLTFALAAVPFAAQAEAVKPTAGLDATDTRPVPIKQVPPIYPAELKKHGVTGKAVVNFIVEKDGSVKVVEIISQTREEFGRAAVACVKQWTFKPGTHAGQPVRCAVATPIVFDLK